MAIHFTSGGDVAATVERLRALANDLERMTMFQPNRELEGSPQLARARLAVRPRPCLTGVVSGHPLLGSRHIVTSEIYAIDTKAGWARTFNRFYRLSLVADGAAKETTHE